MVFTSVIDVKCEQTEHLIKRNWKTTRTILYSVDGKLTHIHTPSKRPFHATVRKGEIEGMTHVLQTMLLPHDFIHIQHLYSKTARTIECRRHTLNTHVLHMLYTSIDAHSIFECGSAIYCFRGPDFIHKYDVFKLIDSLFFVCIIW